MAADSFTSWGEMRQALLQRLRTHVDSSAFMTASITTPDGASHTYRTTDEIRLLLQYVDLQASQERRSGRTLFFQGVPPC